MEQFLTSSKILTGPPFLFDVRTDYVKVTNDTILVPLTLSLKNSDITFTNKDGVAMGTVNILGRVTNLNHKPIQTFEDTVSVQTPSELLQRSKNNASVYWKSLPLRPGLYRVDIVIKDVNNPDHVGTWSRSINVPKYDDERLAHFFADPCRPDGTGSEQGHWRGEFCDRQHADQAKGSFWRGNTGDLPQGAEPELLDAGL